MALMTNAAFDHLSQLMKTECEMNKALSEVDNSTEEGEATGSQDESSHKRIKLVQSEEPLGAATQVALFVECERLHGLRSRTEEENEVRRVVYSQ